RWSCEIFLRSFSILPKSPGAARSYNFGLMTWVDWIVFLASSHFVVKASKRASKSFWGVTASTNRLDAICNLAHPADPAEHAAGIGIVHTDQHRGTDQRCIYASHGQRNPWCSDLQKNDDAAR